MEAMHGKAIILKHLGVFTRFKNTKDASCVVHSTLSMYVKTRASVIGCHLHLNELLSFSVIPFFVEDSRMNITNICYCGLL